MEANTYNPEAMQRPTLSAKYLKIQFLQIQQSIALSHSLTTSTIHRSIKQREHITLRENLPTPTPHSENPIKIKFLRKN